MNDLNLSGVVKLESIRKFVKQNKKVTFIFFDTETTGLISRVGNSFLNNSGLDRDQEKKFNDNEKKKLEDLLSKQEINLDKEGFDSLLKHYNDPDNSTKEIIASINQKDYDKFYKKNPIDYDKFYKKENNKKPEANLENKLKKVIFDFNTWRKKEILSIGKEEVELTEFAAIKFTIDSGKTGYTQSKIQKIHKFFKPKKMSDEIKKLTHWDASKDELGSQEQSDVKYKEIVNFFDNEGSINVIVAHNLLGFDLPAMTLFLNKFPNELEKWKTFLKEPTTFALDTKDIGLYFKKVNKKFPELFTSFEKVPKTNFMRSNQVYLQQLTGVVNNSQHTAIEDVNSLVRVTQVLVKLFYYLNQKSFKDIYAKIKEIKALWKKLSKDEKKIYKGLVGSMVNSSILTEEVLLEKKHIDATFKIAKNFISKRTENKNKRKQFMAVFTAVKNSVLDSGAPIGIAIASGYKKAKESVGIE